MRPLTAPVSAVDTLTTAPARMLFLVTPPGHEQYLQEVAELLARPGQLDPAAIGLLRQRYDIEQLTPMIPNRR